MKVLDRVIQFDHWLFFKVNGTWTNHAFDTVFPFLRESVIWIPFYLFLLVFILGNFGVKGIYWSLGFICTVSFCDIISSHVIKEAIVRVRPCGDPSISESVRFLVKYCPRSSGFVSSHSANHFGMAMFIYATLKPFASRWMGIIFAWAALIAYAQVYVGVHFPLDIIGGALVGYVIARITSRLFNRHIGLWPLTSKA